MAARTARLPITAGIRPGHTKHKATPQTITASEREWLKMTPEELMAWKLEQLKRKMERPDAD